MARASLSVLLPIGRRTCLAGLDLPANNLASTMSVLLDRVPRPRQQFPDSEKSDLYVLRSTHSKMRPALISSWPTHARAAVRDYADGPTLATARTDSVKKIPEASLPPMAQGSRRQCRLTADTQVDRRASRRTRSFHDSHEVAVGTLPALLMD